MKYVEILSEVRENVKKLSLVFGEWKVGTFENKLLKQVFSFQTVQRKEMHEGLGNECWIWQFGKTKFKPEMLII